MLKLPFQMEFIVNLTHRCNMTCNMCTQYGATFKNNTLQEMTYEEWDNFFESIKTIRPRPQITLMGGEPLLHKDFDRILMSAADKKFKVHIVTNGFYLKEHLETIAKAKASLSLSIDGISETHNKIRNTKGSFAKSEECLKLIQEINKSKKIIRTCINFVMLPENIDEILDFVKYMRKYRPSFIGFQHLQFSSDKLDKENNKEWVRCFNKKYTTKLKPKVVYKFNEDYVEKLYSIIEKLRKTYSPTKVYDFPHLSLEEMKEYYLEEDLSLIRKNRICTTPWMSPSITPDGKVSNCICNEIGDLRKEDFWTIFNNDKANIIRKQLAEHGKFPVCSRCCCFYKSNFLVAPNKIIELNDGQKLLLPQELNYITAAKDGVFVYDANFIFENSEQMEYTPVIPHTIHNSKQEMLIEKDNVIVGHYNQML